VRWIVFNFNALIFYQFLRQEYYELLQLTVLVALATHTFGTSGEITCCGEKLYRNEACMKTLLRRTAQHKNKLVINLKKKIKREKKNY